MTLKPAAKYFELEVGRAYEYFRRRLESGLSDEQFNRLLQEMLSVIYGFEHERYEYRGGKVYPRSILLNEYEVMKKLGK